ncbi:MAG: SUMF1/EgtB/PvdO family nonheme iron enzyme [Tannerellaceae bacterium]|nr:SUMF1/EgtB/PvdO family nonheme iron enzyme [Tannerellaceae bacterium]
MKRLLLLCFFFSYSMTTLSAPGYQIRAKISGVKNGTRFFLRDFDTQRIINSAQIEKGELLMKGELFDTPRLVWLTTTLKDEFYYSELFIENDTLLIEGDFRDFLYGLRVQGSSTHQEYARYQEKIKDIQQTIDSLQHISMYLQDLTSDDPKAAKSKRYSKQMKQELKRFVNKDNRVNFELEIDLKTGRAIDRRDVVRMKFIDQHMESPAAQFLLTRVMKKLPMDSLRYFYSHIPLEMRRSKYPRLISNQINPYADQCIKEADRLIAQEGEPWEQVAWAEEAWKLYEEGVHLNPERVEVYIALGSIYERLLPIKGIDAYDISLNSLEKFIASEVTEEEKEVARNRLRDIQYKKKLATSIHPEMVEVKGGTYELGSTYEENNNPLHKVTVNDFYISRYEITNYQFAYFIRAYGSRTVKSGPDEGEPLYYESEWGIQQEEAVPGYESHPALYVTWYGAREYSQWAGGRLPTEDEWEYAARGGRYGNRRHLYSGGMELDSVGWYAGNSEGKTHPVGMKQPNELGLYDMSGNLWEWCAELMEEEGKLYSPVRGGTWFNERAICRPTCRYYIFPNSKHFNNGFRMVKDTLLEEEKK